MLENREEYSGNGTRQITGCGRAEDPAKLAVNSAEGSVGKYGVRSIVILCIPILAIRIPLYAFLFISSSLFCRCTATLRLLKVVADRGDVMAESERISKNGNIGNTGCTGKCGAVSVQWNDILCNPW